VQHIQNYEKYAGHPNPFAEFLKHEKNTAGARGCHTLTKFIHLFNSFYSGCGLARKWSPLISHKYQKSEAAFTQLIKHQYV